MMKFVPIACAALAILVGCAVNKRDYVPPSAPTVPGYGLTPPPQTASANVGGGASQRFRSDIDIPGQWWTLFHSTALNELVERALRANPDLDAAQAALRQAHELVLAQKGAAYPFVQGSLSASRQKTPGIFAPPLNTSADVYSLYTAQVNVAYTPDVFRGIRRQTEAVIAQAEAQRFQFEATYLTLTSNVVAAAVQTASLRGQLAATEHVIAIESELLDIGRKQRSLGAIAGIDVLAFEASLAQAQQTLPPLRKQLAQERDLLATLSGRTPAEVSGADFELASLHLPEELPLSLPSRLVQQRPDVRAAEANLHVASAQVGAAIANRWPNFTIDANTGSAATSLGSMFGAGSGFAALIAGLTEPIYDHGTLKHRQRAAEAAYDQAAAQYRGAVLTAFQNVADTLEALEFDAEALRVAARTTRAAEASLGVVRGQQRLGQVSYLSVLNAEQTYQQASLGLVQTQAARYADTVALFQALGGGWWNRERK